MRPFLLKYLPSTTVDCEVSSTLGLQMLAFLKFKFKLITQITLITAHDYSNIHYT